MSKPGSKPYKWVQTPDGHPQTTKNGLIQEHRLIAEQIVGRILKPEEVVHHIDENTLNNNVNNLMIFAKARDHNAFHMGAPTWSNDGLIWYSSNVIHSFTCKLCGKVFIPKYFGSKNPNEYCSKKCANERNKVAESKLTEEQINNLQNLLRENNGNFTKVAKLLGVTDNAIKHRLQRMGLPYYSKDYK